MFYDLSPKWAKDQQNMWRITQMKGKETSMTEIRSVIQRLRNGQSQRQIHRDLHVHRSIIGELHEIALSHQWMNTDIPMPSDEDIATALARKKDTVLAAHPLDPYKEQIEQWHKQGISSVVIHRLLQDKCSCDIQVVRRYRQKHFPKKIEPVMVRSTVSGRDIEVDFGELGRFFDDEGNPKRVWLFSLRLRHSRKAYREIVLDQTLQTFLMGHVHAFEYFNGVPTNCILDNLKAGVIKSTIDNDQINRSYQDLAEYYGFIISPCLPRTPQHKGGVEGDVKYAKGNFLPYFIETSKEKGILVPTIRSLIEALDKWTEEVADVHIVQGVGKSPQEIFCSEEQKVLNPLPKQRWEPTSWAQCTVRRDWRIMFNSSYYSVPFHLIGKKVEVCATSTFVRIFHENKEVALHERATKKWDYKRKTEHAPPAHEAVLNCSREGLLVLAEAIGPFTRQLSEEILSHPSVDKLRPVRHLLQLATKYSKERLEIACQRAFNCRLFAYSNVKNILEKELDSQSIDPEEVSKVINLDKYRFCRNLDEYRSETFPKKETFDETLLRIRPYSTHGNGMMRAYEAQLADQIMEEYLKDGEQQ
jgi:transposase